MTKESATDEVLKIEANNEGIWISALSPNFNMARVLSFLTSQGVRKYDENVVKEFVRTKIRTPQKIAPRDEAEENRAPVVVRVDDDGMSASVTIEPPFFTRPWPSLEDIKESLAREGVVFGLDEDVIGKLARLKIAGEAIAVAQGTPVQNGENARIEFLVDPDLPLELDPDARKIDYKEISAFVHVHEGQEVAVIHPPTAGEAGMSVLGKEIKPIPGKDIVFPVETGLNVSEDGLHLIAALDGRLVRKDSRLSVLPELEVSGDVDFNTGNIDFPGCVKIKGVVKDGFKVVSVGDVDVREMVEGAYVKSDGNIFVAGGVRAMGRGRLISGGDITASFVDQAYMRAQGSIYIKNSLLHSDAGANESVKVVGGRKSQIAGGKILAGIEVVCQILGSEMGTKTEVVVGISAERAERRQELQIQIPQYEDNIAKLDNNLAFLKSLEMKNALTQKGQEQKISTMKAKFQMQAALISMTKELKELEECLELTKTKGIVRVRDICYPGVSVTIRSVVYKVKEAFKFVSFVYDNGEIRLRTFDA